MVIPILAMFLLGMVSAGSLWDKKLSLEHAAREGARFGATVPPDQQLPVGATWATAVRDLVVNRSAGTLKAADVCVSLVEGGYAGRALAVVARSDLSRTQSFYTTNGSSPCIAGETYPFGNDQDVGRRVQIRVSSPGRLEALLVSFPLTLTSSATAKSEGPV